MPVETKLSQPVPARRAEMGGRTGSNGVRQRILVPITNSMFLLSAVAFPSPKLVGLDHVFAVGTDPWPGGVHSSAGAITPAPCAGFTVRHPIRGGLDTF